jgi:nitrilase
MDPVKVAAVQAAPVLLDRDQTIDKVVARARSSRQQFDPVGHFNRPDVFRLHVDTSPRPPVVETKDDIAAQ